MDWLSACRDSRSDCTQGRVDEGVLLCTPWYHRRDTTLIPPNTVFGGSRLNLLRHIILGTMLEDRADAAKSTADWGDKLGALLLLALAPIPSTSSSHRVRVDHLT